MSETLFGADPKPAAATAAEPLSIYVHFEDRAGMEDFARAIRFPVSTRTRSFVFPIDQRLAALGERAVSTAPDEPRKEQLAAQSGLFGDKEPWEELWLSMPEFVQEDLAPWHSVQVDLQPPVEKSRAEFEKLVGQAIPDYEKRTPSIWHPEAEIGRFADKRYVARPPLAPKYPVYVISKGRWESRHTSKALERMGVPYRIVVEPGERARYEAVVDPAKLLVLPRDTGGMTGATTARNFVYDHAVATGAARHWCLDDNIDGFFRLNRNLKVPVADGTIFRAAEEFVDRFENVGQAGFHYFMFASRKTKMPPFTLNSRVYSCMLLRNDLDFRFRGRFNDDTDFSLRLLKAGYATVLFTAFLAFKMTTMSVKGGLADTLYKIENARKIGSEWLRTLHPVETQVVEKWGRYHHEVDYSPFVANKLRPRAGLAIADGVDNFGMYLHVDEAKKVAA